MSTAEQPGPRVVLVADRDQTVRELLEFFLGREGFAVEFAGDGEHALDRARTARPALLVTEILIPKLDGLALCRRLREDPDTRDLPVIVFSILAAAGRAAEAGADAFLRKPLVEPVFMAEVHRLVTRAPTEALEKH